MPSAIALESARLKVSFILDTSVLVEFLARKLELGV